MITRRSLLALPAVLAACSKNRPVFSGYAFVANQGGGAVAVVDLELFTVAKHIPISGNPVQVVSTGKRGSVYALTPDTSTVHEIDAERLAFKRKLSVDAKGTTMTVSPDERFLHILAREPRVLVTIDLDSFRVSRRLTLPDDPSDLTLSEDDKFAAISFPTGARLVDLASSQLSRPLSPGGDLGPLRFLADGKTLIVANRSEHLISVFDVGTQRLISHLPVQLRPEQLCFNRDGGQLFITGPGKDAVVVVYPYRTPEIAETVLIGHAPGAMAATSQYLLVASPQSGDVSILNIPSRKVVALVQVGSDPGFVAVTPDDQYALVLNRASGDMSVLRLATITPNRYKSAGLLTVIPVGTRPVSAAVRALA